MKPVNCPTCRQNMNDSPRNGWQGIDCPTCGQGLRSVHHLRLMLARLSKVRPAGRVLADGYTCEDRDKAFLADAICSMQHCGRADRERYKCRRVEVREVEGKKQKKGI